MRTIPALAPLLLLLAACGGSEAGEGAPDSEEHATGGTGGHVHSAPHGGTLVVLAEEQANAELVLDSELGELTLYLLDGHAENPVRSDMDGARVTIQLSEVELVLTLQPVASSLSGESAGDTSRFLAAHPNLVGIESIEGTIAEIRMRGLTFEDVEFHCD